MLIDFKQRDGALENDIVSHEVRHCHAAGLLHYSHGHYTDQNMRDGTQNTHGITNRLTGGGTGRCLQTNEAGGMGEGWSDAFAE